MIVLAILVYANFLQGVAIPMNAFIGGAIFDLALAEVIFE